MHIQRLTLLEAERVSSRLCVLLLRESSWLRLATSTCWRLSATSMAGAKRREKINLCCGTNFGCFPGPNPLKLENEFVHFIALSGDLNTLNLGYKAILGKDHSYPQLTLCLPRTNPLCATLFWGALELGCHFMEVPRYFSTVLYPYATCKIIRKTK